MNQEEKTELLGCVTACQSAYYIESTPGHVFGGLPGKLQENRDELVNVVQDLLDAKDAEIASIRKDAERLNWLIENDAMVRESEPSKYHIRWATEVRFSGTFNSAREAIDAVINGNSTCSHATS